MKKVIAIGEALIDFIPGQTDCTLEQVETFTRACGGAPANVAAAVSLLGCRSALLTKLGQDAFGNFIVQTLTDAGVDCSHVLRTDRASTSLAFVSLRADGGRDFSFYRNPGADMLLSPEDLDPKFFSDCASLHFCSVDLVECPTKYAHLRAIEYAKSAGALISFDPNIRLPLWGSAADCQKAVREFLPYADLIKISDEESEFVTGYADPDKAVQSLLDGGAKAVLLSLGGKGAMLRSKGASCMVPAYPAKVLDTTGAGDCLIGALLYRLCRDGIDADGLAALSADRMRDYLTFACRCAGMSTERHGAIASYPTKGTMGL